MVLPLSNTAILFTQQPDDAYIMALKWLMEDLPIKCFLLVTYAGCQFKTKKITGMVHNIAVIMFFFNDK